MNTNVIVVVGVGVAVMFLSSSFLLQMGGEKKGVKSRGQRFHPKDSFKKIRKKYKQKNRINGLRTVKKASDEPR